MTINFFTFILFISIPYSIYSQQEKCCEDLGVPEICFKSVCRPSLLFKDSDKVTPWNRFNHCQVYVSKIAKCLTLGRDSSRCCQIISRATEDEYAFGMCSGYIVYDKKSYNWQETNSIMRYINEIFLCVIPSWTNAPTAPRNLTVVVNTEDTATLNWNEPEKLPDLVDHYKIFLSARTGKLETETFFTTKEKEFKLEGLLTQFGYTANVVAIAAPFNGSDDWYKSQRSNIIGFVTGEELQISTAEIRTPSITKNLTMHCSLRLIAGTKNEIEWVKVNGNKSEILEEGEKYNVTFYVDKENKESMMSGLRISGFNNETDFGAYRCYMKNFRIEYGEVVVTEFNFMEQPPMDSPPETVLECCLRQSHLHRSRCYSICYQDDQEKKTRFIPSDYYPVRRNCAKEAHVVFRCALKSFNNVACCIHAKIPFRCLGLCDTNFEADPEKVPYCYNNKAFYTCNLETVSVKPDPITNVDVTHSTFSSVFKFTWTKSTDADVHHIYYRIKDHPWHVLVTTGTIFNIRKADELVILTVNEFGYSQPYRLAYDINGWAVVDHWLVKIKLIRSLRDHLVK